MFKIMSFILVSISLSLSANAQSLKPGNIIKCDNEKTKFRITIDKTFPAILANSRLLLMNKLDNDEVTYSNYGYLALDWTNNLLRLSIKTYQDTTEAVVQFDKGDMKIAYVDLVGPYVGTLKYVGSECFVK